MLAVEVKLHRKPGGKKPCPPGVKLDQILLDNLVNLLVNGGEMGWGSIEAILKRGQSAHVEARSGEPAGKTTIPTLLVPISR